MEEPCANEEEEGTRPQQSGVPVLGPSDVGNTVEGVTLRERAAQLLIRTLFE